MSDSFWIMHDIKINYDCVDDYIYDETSINLQIDWDNNKILYHSNREYFFEDVDNVIRVVLFSNKIELLNDIFNSKYIIT